jgi:hypothetical protein
MQTSRCFLPCTAYRSESFSLVTPEAAAVVLETSRTKAPHGFSSFLGWLPRGATPDLKHLEILRQCLGLQLQIVNYFPDCDWRCGLTWRENMSGISCQHGSAHRPLVAASRRKREGPRPENIDAVRRKLNIRTRHSSCCQ